MSHHIIEIDNVHYKYPDGQPALNGVSFQVLHGESVGIIGANGAGKSTLLMQFVGLLFPTIGEIRLGHVPVTKKTLSLVRQRVGMIFQDADDQLFMNTVYEDVAFGPRNYSLPESEVDSRVHSALEKVGILHLINRPPYKLSGGEKKAAALAAILAMEPDVLVLDEPSASLDPRARRRLIELLSGFTHTKIIATHDLDLVLDLCERTIVLKEGAIIADGPTGRIFLDDALLLECGMEKPLSMQHCPICTSGTIARNGGL